MHFDFTTPRGLKITPSDGTKKLEEEEKDDKRVEENRLTFLLFFISSTLEREHLRKARFLKHRFQEIYFHAT